MNGDFLAPARNVELKARLADLDSARRTAQRLATSELDAEHQIDTYFQCATGRLKLRQIAGRNAVLIAYSRIDVPERKTSHYRLVEVVQPESLKQALASALGVPLVVEKRREIFLVDNVRIHLDTVASLGMFLEFEAVLAPGIDEAAGQRQLDRLSAEFGIQKADLVPGSYADLLASASEASAALG